MNVSVELLADHPEAIQELANALTCAWPNWYGVVGDAVSDLRERLRRDGLPLGLVALHGTTPIGTAALVARSTASHIHLTPWLVGLWVAPLRRNGRIGPMLVASACEHARRLGYDALYVASARPRAARARSVSLGNGTTDGGDRVEVFQIALR